jgi:hypothetical protein
MVGASERVIHGTVLMRMAGAPEGKMTARPGGSAARSEISRMW